jgi:hypothetical protein
VFPSPTNVDMFQFFFVILFNIFLNSCKPIIIFLEVLNFNRFHHKRGSSKRAWVDFSGGFVMKSPLYMMENSSGCQLPLVLWRWHVGLFTGFMHYSLDHETLSTYCHVDFFIHLNHFGPLGLQGLIVERTWTISNLSTT